MTIKSILVTGGAGYIGSICVEKLISEGFQVTVIDNLKTGHREAVSKDANFFYGDIGCPENLNEVFKNCLPDAVLHFAGSTLVGESITKPLVYFKNNTINGFTLLECAKSYGVRKFIFSSTCATYGIPAQTPITESSPQIPTNPYGESKLAFERMLLSQAMQSEMESVIFRYFNAAGATKKYGEFHAPETHLIPRLLQVAMGQLDSLAVYGTNHPTPDGTCIRDYIHVEDLASAHILALNSGVKGDYNLGRGKGDSVHEIIKTCRKITDHPIPIKELPARPEEPAELVASTQKALTQLDWKAKHHSTDSIIESAWTWMKKNPKGYGQST
tara:strand:- start:389 stop:1375 length:987 start_codon:yes stop_codon:yes gene_type:complete